jgi:diguanylate cyclase (GGDEF)-like protein
MPPVSEDGSSDPSSTEARTLDTIALTPEFLNLLPIGLQIDDLDARTVFVNDSFTRMLGYGLDEIARPEDWFRLAYPDPAYRDSVVGEWTESLDEAAARQRDIAPQERVVTCKNGERKIIEFHIRRIGDYYIYLHIDVSARHNLAAELRRLANTDALTGVANRRNFFEAGTALIASRRGPLAALVFDLDRFKAVNDEHGHAVGDQILVEAAARCRGVLGPGHVFARLGGEEFGVLLPDCDRAAAIDVAERLRAAVARTAVPVLSSEVTVTISVGGACWTPEDTAIDTLLVRADLALYAAKHAGRNQVCFETC